MSSVKSATQTARRKLGQLVHEPSFADLSEVDRTFLLTMAVDDGPSRMADIARRLKVDPRYAGTYRKRLIEAEMIGSVGHGLVEFELPYMPDFRLTLAPSEFFQEPPEAEH